MKLDMAIADAYGDFLEVFPDQENSQIVFSHFALDELGFSKREAAGFSRKVMVEDEDEINSPEFDRFYTWYYFNYMIDTESGLTGGMGLGVTKQGLTRTRLLQRDINFRNSILKAPVAMCIFRGARHIVEIANDRMVGLWGRTAEEVMNKPIFEGLPEARDQGFEQLLDKVFNTGETFAAQGVPVMLLRKGEMEVVYVNFVYEAYREPDGTISGIISVASDVTDQVLAHRKIEELVVERTRELAETNKMLEKSNTELARYAFVVSHDLQEPARKVSIFGQMLKNRLTNIDAQSQSYLDKINLSVARMLAMLRDTLSYSELSKEPEPFEPVDLNGVLQDICAEFELMIEEKKADIFCETLPVVEGISFQLSQLFRNLVSNALKFARRDTPPVICIAGRYLDAREVVQNSLLAAGKAYCLVEVMDNGIGFSQEHAERIFGIFQRLHEKSKYPGTGVGLAMCKRIAQNHHGDIYATSNPGSGTVFSVILPLEHEEPTI